MLLLYEEENLAQNAARLRRIQTALEFWEDWHERGHGLLVAQLVLHILQAVVAVTILPQELPPQTGEVGPSLGRVVGQIEQQALLGPEREHALKEPDLVQTWGPMPVLVLGLERLDVARPVASADQVAFVVVEKV